MKGKGMSLEEIRKDLKQDLEEIGLVDKYDVVLTTNVEPSPEDSFERTVMNIDSILVETEKDDTLKDIEDAVIEFIKQQYSDKEIFSITAIEHIENEDECTSK